jgi:hypothetical protein
MVSACCILDAHDCRDCAECSVSSLHTNRHFLLLRFGETCVAIPRSMRLWFATGSEGRQGQVVRLPDSRGRTVAFWSPYGGHPVTAADPADLRRGAGSCLGDWVQKSCPEPSGERQDPKDDGDRCDKTKQASANAGQSCTATSQGANQTGRQRAGQGRCDQEAAARLRASGLRDRHPRAGVGQPGLLR